VLLGTLADASHHPDRYGWTSAVPAGRRRRRDEFLRHGGRTSCVAVAHDRDEMTTLVLDAGTELRAVLGSRHCG